MSVENRVEQWVLERLEPILGIKTVDQLFTAYVKDTNDRSLTKSQFADYMSNTVKRHKNLNDAKTKNLKGFPAYHLFLTSEPRGKSLVPKLLPDQSPKRNIRDQIYGKQRDRYDVSRKPMIKAAQSILSPPTFVGVKNPDSESRLEFDYENKYRTKSDEDVEESKSGELEKEILRISRLLEEAQERADILKDALQTSEETCETLTANNKEMLENLSQVREEGASRQHTIQDMQASIDEISTENMNLKVELEQTRIRLKAEIAEKDRLAQSASLRKSQTSDRMFELIVQKQEQKLRELEKQGETMNKVNEEELNSLETHVWRLGNEIDQTRGQKVEQLSEELSEVRKDCQSIKARVDIVKRSLFDEKTDRRTCVICSERLGYVLFLPCQHQRVCQICSFQINQCPLCRKVITSKIAPYS